MHCGGDKHMLPIGVIPHSIYLCSRHVDFRKCFDGLCGEIRNYMGGDPLDRSLFVFYNRRRDRLKMLLWDDDCFWLLYNQASSHYTSCGYD
jgi:transposase